MRSGPPSPAAHRTTALAVLAAGVLLLTASGCGLLGSGDDEGSAEETATRLARALTEHTLDGVPLRSASDAARFTALVAPLREHPVEVSVADLEEDGESAVATLRWAWDLDARSWTYETSADLVLDTPDERQEAGGEDRRWRVDWRPSTLEPSLGPDDVLDVVRPAPARADVLGADGTALVTSRPVVRYGLDKSALRPREVADAAVRVARAVGIDPAGYRKAARAAGPRAFVEAVVLRADEAETTVGAAFDDIPGALAVPDELPLAPTREFAAPLLGRVGPATAEIIAEADGRVREGDPVGLSGLQARYQDQLAGTAGLEVRATPVEGCPQWPQCPSAGERRSLVSWDPTPGRPLRLTLDAALQQRAEDALTDALSGTADPPVSALVALRPSTGAILAAADGPGNDGLNAATFGQYAPGSTFKVVTSLALIRAGVRPDDVLPCTPTITVDGKRFKNYDDYPGTGLGDVSFRTALANSCNTALIAARDRLGPGDLTRAAASLGLGVDHDLGFPAYFGQVPSATGETEKAAGLIGQGKVLASPLAMAGVAASVAAGRTVVPHLLAEKDDGPDTAPSAGTPPLTAAEATQLQRLMRAVVTEGSGRFLADLPGEVGAKTGTAEYGQPDAGGSLPTHAWMIAARGDLAVAVFVETGESGSATAGPILEAFLR